MDSRQHNVSLKAFTNIVFNVPHPLQQFFLKKWEIMVHACTKIKVKILVVFYVLNLLLKSYV